MIVSASPRKRVRFGLKAILIVLLVILIAAAYYLNSLLPIITGYAAKNLASGVFVSGRTQEDMENNDLNFSFIAKANNTVDFDNKKVTSKFLWGKSEAVYREGFGVTLLRDISEEELLAIKFPEDIYPGYSVDTIPWPMGNILTRMDTSGVNQALQELSDRLVKEDLYGGDNYAALIIHKGLIAGESYDDRFDSNTRFLSWSMAKSVVNGLIGIKIMEDESLSLDQLVRVEDWDGDKSTRGLTLNNLLQMQSGLKWNEDYGNRSDVTVMLHEASDFAKYTYSMDFEYDPGTHWYYSSGTTNFVSYLLRKSFDSDKQYYAFPYQKLFYKIGITDAVLEIDPSGTYVGSSYLYMTARDYARFALLYLQDGVFCGERILPKDWVEYSVSENSHSDGDYGAFFWLNRGDLIEGAPEDMFMCIGHDGQRIFILPTQDLIIILLGYSPSGTVDYSGLVKGVLETLD